MRIQTLLLMTMTQLAVACDTDAPEFRFGDPVVGLRYELASPDEGIHPDSSVLDNPRNPYRGHIVGAETKFELLELGGNTGAFYAWATLLAEIPSGEHQFYTAELLTRIVDSGEVTEDDAVAVEDMAIRAYQAVLDYFPDDVTFLADGTSFRLATPSFKAIQARGGRVLGDWVMVTTPTGEEAMQGGSTTRKDVGQ